MAAREHASLQAQTGSGDLDEVANAQTCQLAPPQTTEPEDGDQLGIPARRSAGEVVELVGSEDLPLAARPSSARKGVPVATFLARGPSATANARTERSVDR